MWNITRTIKSNVSSNFPKLFNQQKQAQQNTFLIAISVIFGLGLFIAYKAGERAANLKNKVTAGIPVNRDLPRGFSETIYLPLSSILTTQYITLSNEIEEAKKRGDRSISLAIIQNDQRSNSLDSKGDFWAYYAHSLLSDELLDPLSRKKVMALIEVEVDIANMTTAITTDFLAKDLIKQTGRYLGELEKIIYQLEADLSTPEGAVSIDHIHGCINALIKVFLSNPEYKERIQEHLVRLAEKGIFVIKRDLPQILLKHHQNAECYTFLIEVLLDVMPFTDTVKIIVDCYNALSASNATGFETIRMIFQGLIVKNLMASPILNLDEVDGNITILSDLEVHETKECSEGSFCLHCTLDDLKVLNEFLRLTKEIQEPQLFQTIYNSEDITNLVDSIQDTRLTELVNVYNLVIALDSNSDLTRLKVTQNIKNEIFLAYKRLFLNLIPHLCKLNISSEERAKDLLVSILETLLNFSMETFNLVKLVKEEHNPILVGGVAQLSNSGRLEEFPELMSRLAELAGLVINISESPVDIVID